MIGKAKSISHSYNTLDYFEKNVNAELIDKNLIAGETPREIVEEFRIFQDLNTRCERNNFTMVISPDVEDAKKMSNQDFHKLTRDFMKKMNLDKQQYVAYLHKDKVPHIHIISNRIDTKGKAIKDNFLSNTASRKAEELAREKGMIVAKDKQIQKQLECEKKYEHVFKAHKSILNSSPKNLGDYTNKMKKAGYEPIFKLSKQNKIVGVQFKIDGQLIKGSLINKAMTGMRIEKAVLEIAKKLTKNLGKGLSMGI